MERDPRLPQDHGDIDVITLYAPRTLPDADFDRRIAEWSSQDRAILVVLPYVLDDSSLERLHIAGADLCVVAPTTKELVTHVERARGRHTRVRTGRTIRDEQLDALWRERFDIAAHVDDDGRNSLASVGSSSGCSPPALAKSRDSVPVEPSVSSSP